MTPQLREQLQQDLLEYSKNSPIILSIQDESITYRLFQIYPNFFYKTKQLTKKKMAALFLLSFDCKVEPVCEFCSKSVSDSFPWKKATAAKDTLTPYGGWSRTCSSSCNQLLIERDGTRKKTFIDKFGYDNPMKIPGFAKEAVSNRVIDWELHGTNQRIATFKKNNVSEKLTSQFGFTKESIDTDVEILITVAEEYKALHSELPNRIQLSKFTSIPIQTLNEIFFKSSKYQDLYYSEHNKSNGEMEVRQFLQSIGIIPDRSDRTLIKNVNGNPLELDIPIHSRKLAIEFSGIIWHREGLGKTSEYHLRKTEECEKIEYQLLQIYDVEWNDPIKKEIWKSIIKAKLGIFERKFFARKCELVSIDSKTARIFLSENHLHGFVGSEKHIGLEYNNELIMVLSYGKSRFDNTTEIIRMASKRNCIVLGGMSKLISNVKKYATGSITCYADRRYSSSLNCSYGIVFDKTNATGPNWDGFNIKEYILRSRHTFMRHKLISRSDFIFDETVSVYQNMLNNGYDRIWNSGNLKFTYNAL